MKKVKDNFSKQAVYYQKYRPTYPKELIEAILSLVKVKESCWDCGTGNGQVAALLSGYFEEVFATDISQKQIDRALQKENITYAVERSEQTSFDDNQFDLITVAQALHWFDFKAFNKEIKRVIKKGGILAIWGYGLLRIEPTIDTLISIFYKEIIGPYWSKERKYVDDQYQTIPLDFSEIKLPKEYEIEISWTLGDLEGYLNSWSSVQHYISRHGNNPVDGLIQNLVPYWNPTAQKKIRFPIFTRIGSIDK